MFIEGETGTAPFSLGYGYGFMQPLFDGEDARSNGLIAMLLLGLLFVTLFIIIASPAIRERLRLFWERLLSRIAEPWEKYAYAYSVYAKYMEHSHGRVLVSDTPRERSEKVRFDERYPDAVQYAEVFEELRYANEAVGIVGLDERLTVLQDYLRGVLQ